MNHSVLAILAFALASGCASTGSAPERAAAEAPETSVWSNVEKLRVGTPIRVTERDSDRSYGRLMQVSDLGLTLELVASSKTIPRDEILLIERFPASLPSSVPRAALGVGTALTLSSTYTPKTYRRTVAPAQEDLEKGSEPYRNGFYVDALSLVGTAAEMVNRAIESTRQTVVVYRAR